MGQFGREAAEQVADARGPAARQRPQRRPGQLAWLTDDMLNPSTRTGGIDTRLK